MEPAPAEESERRTADDHPAGVKTRTKKKTPEKRSLTTPTAASKAREIILWLRGRIDPRRARGVQQYFKHEVAALGIDTPTLREFASSHSKKLAGAWTVHEATSLCHRLLQEPELEIRGTGILMLSAFKRQFCPGLS